MHVLGNEEEQLWTGWQNSGHPYASNVLGSFRAYDVLDTLGKSWKHEHVHPSHWGEPPFPNEGDQYPHEKHEPYRRLMGPRLVGEAIAARILGLQAYWNYPAFFCYMDRWMYEDDASSRATLQSIWGVNFTPAEGSGGSLFQTSMYLSFRPLYGDQCTNGETRPCTLRQGVCVWFF